jgi:hypothetical protein
MTVPAMSLALRPSALRGRFRPYSATTVPNLFLTSCKVTLRALLVHLPSSNRPKAKGDKPRIKNTRTGVVGAMAPR